MLVRVSESYFGSLSSVLRCIVLFLTSCVCLLFQIGAEGPGGPEFKAYKEKTEAAHGVQFFTSLSDLPAVADGKKRLALISGRTADNPRLLSEAIKVRFYCLSVCALFSTTQRLTFVVNERMVALPFTWKSLEHPL